MNEEVKSQEEYKDFCRLINQEGLIRNSIFTACATLYEVYSKTVIESPSETRIVCLSVAAEKLNMRKNEALHLVQLAFTGRFFLFAHDEVLFNEMLDRGLRMYID